jgi:hypothetical protein
MSWGLPVAILVVSQFLIGGRRFPALFAVVVTIFAVQSLFLHKEWRFVFPALPPLITLCGIATVQELSDIRRFLGERQSLKIALAAMALGVWSLLSLDVAAMPMPQDSLSRKRELILAFDLAKRQRPLCGLNIVAIPWPATPGSAALPDQVPIYNDPSIYDPRTTAAYNVVITNALLVLPNPYRRLHCYSGSSNYSDRSFLVACVWIRDGSCTPGAAKTPQPNWPRYFLNPDGTLRRERVQMYQRRPL